MKYVRIPLEGAYNVRELGGYPINNGITSFNSFLRGDSLEKVTDKDLRVLEEYGIKNVIDLRGDIEIGDEVKIIKDNSNLNYKQISLFGDIEKAESEDITKMLVDNPEEFLVEIYISALTEAKNTMKKVFDHIATSEGGILFHCTDGKDRTGIISSLLLNLAGVKKSDIISNYQITHTYIKENPEVKEQAKQYSEELTYSKPEYMEKLLKYLEKNYNNAESYLENIAVTEENIEKIKQRLIE
ncbi:MAG: tyrosine-protein phosphatase [Methanobacteriaceae archaeon]|jgi:protein-tyrosine phosphatase|nr:tyrosine-protein phosphatase [Methanobacteriaceae archaeon]